MILLPSGGSNVFLMGVGVKKVDQSGWTNWKSLSVLKGELQGVNYCDGVLVVVKIFL